MLSLPLPPSLSLLASPVIPDEARRHVILETADIVPSLEVTCPIPVGALAEQYSFSLEIIKMNRVFGTTQYSPIAMFELEENTNGFRCTVFIKHSPDVIPRPYPGPVIEIERNGEDIIVTAHTCQLPLHFHL